MGIPLITLLLAFALPLHAQDTATPTATPGATPLNRAIAAFTDLYTLCITEHKHLDTDVITKIIDGLKQQFPEYSEAYLKAGQFYAEFGDPDSAMRQYQEGMAADTSRKIIYQKRIIDLLIRQKKLAEAYQVNREILSDHPKDSDARGLDGSFLLDRGDAGAALTELQSVVKDAPDNFLAHFNLGRAWFAKGNLDDARQQFEAALKLRADYNPARIALIQLAMRRGDPDTALKYADEALKRDPNNSPAMLLQAAALLRKGEVDQARTILERLLKSNPNQPDALLELGVLNLTQKRFGEAEQAFRKAYTVDPGNLRGLLGVSQVHFDQNEPDKAVQVIAEEAQNQPQRTDLQKELANAEFRAKQFDKAIAVYQSLLDRLKDSPLDQADIDSRIALVWAAQGNPLKAIENMQKAAQLVPANGSYQTVLAQFYDIAGKPMDAMTTYRQALKLDPNNGAALNNLAYIMTQNGGDLDEALALAQHARQVQPKMEAVVDTVGWIYLKKNLTASAVEVFRELTGQSPNNPTYHYHYAMALAQKGDKAAALQELNTALDHHPNPNEEKEIRELIRSLS